jgi:hypothetical protein
MKMDYDLKSVASELAKKKGNAEGLISREVAVQLGKNYKIALKFIRDAIDAGLCECAGRKIITRIDGAPQVAPCYRFIDGTKPAKTAKKKK